MTNQGDENAPGEIPGRQPNSSRCFVCGLDNHTGLGLVFYNVGVGQVEARYSVDRAYEGYPGVVHGGIVAAMLDEAVGRVAMTEDPNHFLVTAKLELRYRAPVPIEQELRIVAQRIRDRGAMTESEGWIYLPDGSVAVEAKSLLADRPGGRVESSLLEDLGWKVYYGPIERDLMEKSK